MMHVECPWCAGEATIEVADRDAFVCTGCGIQAELSPEPAAVRVAQAA